MERKSKPVVKAKASSAQPLVPELVLKRCIGLGSTSHDSTPAAAWHPTSPGVLAYVAGCHAVLFDTLTKQQLRLFKHKRPAPRLALRCIAFKPDGQHVAAGEVGPGAPEVHIWETATGKHCQQLKHHKHGVGSLSFSADGRLLLSAGVSYDGQLCVWDWQSGVVLARVVAGMSVLGACFTEDCGAVMCAGKEQIKMWTVTASSNGGGVMGGRPRAVAVMPGSLTLHPKPVLFKDFKTSTFVAIQPSPAHNATAAAHSGAAAVESIPPPPAARGGPTAAAAVGPGASTNGGGVYALTGSGVLLLVVRAGGRAVVEKSVDLQVRAAHALAVGGGTVAACCAAGVVRLFAVGTLAFKGNLPRPSPTLAAAQRCSGLRDSTHGPLGASPAPSKAGSSGGGALGGRGAVGASELFPDAVAGAFDAAGCQLAVCYSDHTLVLWDVRNLAKITRLRCLLSHSAAIWDAALLPLPSTLTTTMMTTPGGEAAAAAPPTAHALATCGADGTVRVWSLEVSAVTGGAAGPAGAGVNYAVGARTLRGVLVARGVDAPGALQGEVMGVARGSVGGGRAGGPEAAAVQAAAAAPVQLRCMRVSHDGRHLATGDMHGNVRVYDLATLSLISDAVKEAHDGPVMAMDYSPHTLGEAGFLATSGRDGVIHVFDVASNYTLVNTLEEHSAAVTAVRFSPCGLRLVSASADRQLLFRTVTRPSDCTTHLYATTRVPGAGPGPLDAGLSKVGTPEAVSKVGGPGRGVVYDLALHAEVAVAAVQGGLLRVYDLTTGAQTGVVEGGQGSGGEFVRVTLDPSGTCAVCACADGSVQIFSLPSHSPANHPSSLASHASPPPAARGASARGVAWTAGAAAAAGAGGGQLLARVAGHAEMATVGLLLGGGAAGLVSVGGDGCILHWQLPPAVLAHLQAAQAAAGIPPLLAGAVARDGQGHGWQQQAVVPGPAAVAVVRRDGAVTLKVGVPAAPAGARGGAKSAWSAEGPAGEQRGERQQLPLAVAAWPAVPAAAAAALAGPTATDSPERLFPVAGCHDDDDEDHPGAPSAMFLRVQQGRPLQSTDKLPRWAAQRVQQQQQPPPPPAALMQPNNNNSNNRPVLQAGAVVAPSLSAGPPAGVGMAPQQEGGVRPVVMMGTERVTATGGYPTPLPPNAALWGEVEFDLEEDDGLCVYSSDGEGEQQQQEEEEGGAGGGDRASGARPAAEPAASGTRMGGGSRFSVQSSQVDTAATAAGEDEDDGDDAAVVGGAPHHLEEPLPDQSPPCPPSGGASNDPAARKGAKSGAAGAGAGGQQQQEEEEEEDGVVAPLEEGDGHVRRDLFREHYGGLDENCQASRSNTPLLGGMMMMAGGARPGAFPPAPPEDSRRLSLTAAVRRLASSLLAAGPAGEALAETFTSTTPHQGWPAPRTLPPAPPLGHHLPHAAAPAASKATIPPPPVALGAFPAPRAAGNDDVSPPRLLQPRSPAPPWAAAAAARADGDGTGATSALTPLRGGPEGSSLSQLAARDAARSPGNHRAGRLEGDLVKMRERLAALQTQFAEQQARATPWRKGERTRSRSGCGGPPGSPPPAVRDPEAHALLADTQPLALVGLQADPQLVDPAPDTAVSAVPPASPQRVQQQGREEAAESKAAGWSMAGDAERGPGAAPPAADTQAAPSLSAMPAARAAAGSSGVAVAAAGRVVTGLRLPACTVRFPAAPAASGGSGTTAARAVVSSAGAPGGEGVGARSGAGEGAPLAACVIRQRVTAGITCCPVAPPPPANSQPSKHPATTATTTAAPTGSVSAGATTRAVSAAAATEGRTAQDAEAIPDDARTPLAHGRSGKGSVSGSETAGAASTPTLTFGVVVRPSSLLALTSPRTSTRYPLSDGPGHDQDTLRAAYDLATSRPVMPDFAPTASGGTATTQGTPPLVLRGNDAFENYEVVGGTTPPAVRDAVPTGLVVAPGAAVEGASALSHGPAPAANTGNGSAAGIAPGGPAPSATCSSGGGGVAGEAGRTRAPLVLPPFTRHPTVKSQTIKTMRAASPHKYGSVMEAVAALTALGHAEDEATQAQAGGGAPVAAAATATPAGVANKPACQLAAGTAAPAGTTYHSPGSSLTFGGTSAVADAAATQDVCDSTGTAQGPCTSLASDTSTLNRPAGVAVPPLKPPPLIMTPPDVTTPRAHPAPAWTMPGSGGPQGRGSGGAGWMTPSPRKNTSGRSTTQDSPAGKQKLPVMHQAALCSLAQAAAAVEACVEHMQQSQEGDGEGAGGAEEGTGATGAKAERARRRRAEGVAAQTLFCSALQKHVEALQQLLQRARPAAAPVATAGLVGGRDSGSTTGARPPRSAGGAHHRRSSSLSLPANASPAAGHSRRASMCQAGPGSAGGALPDVSQLLSGGAGTDLLAEAVARRVGEILGVVAAARPTALQ